ncbi:MAG: hypothetical protein MJ225_02520 [Bacilli bacterium]|nr:hypothetical protein [Bacilli bacterium]
MKHKKLTIIALSLGLTLVSCGGKGSDKASLTPEQQAQATAIEQFIETTLKEEFPEAEAKPYAELAALNGGQLDKLMNVITTVTSGEFTPTTLLSLAAILGEKDVTKGIVYIGSAFLNTAIDCAKSLQEAASFVPLINSAQTFLNTELNGLATNLGGLIENTVTMVSSVIANPSFMESISTIYNKETDLVNVPAVKNIITTVTSALLAQMPVYRVELVYLAGFLNRTIDFAINTLSQVGPLLPVKPDDPTPQIIGLVAETLQKLKLHFGNQFNLPVIAGNMVDLVTSLVTKLATVPNEAYEYGAQITQKTEQRAYLVLLLLETFKIEEIPEITSEQMTHISQLVTTLYGDIKPLLQNVLPGGDFQTADQMVQMVLGLLTHNNLIPDVLNIVIHLYNNFPKDFSAKELSSAIGAIGEEFFDAFLSTEIITIKLTETTPDQVPAEYKENIPNFDYWVDQFSREDYYGGQVREEKTTTPVIQKVAEHRYTYQYAHYIGIFNKYGDEVRVAYGKRAYDIKLLSDFEPAIIIIADFLTELATSNLFNELVEDAITGIRDLLEYKDDDGSALMGLIPPNVVEVIETVLSFLLPQTADSTRVVTDAVDGILIIIGNILNLNLVAQDGKPARVDATLLILNLIAGNMDGVMNMLVGHLDADSLNGISELCVMVYNYLIDMKLSNIITEIVKGLGGNPELIKNAQDFAAFISNALMMFIDPATIPQA